jgi:Uncharacterised nucleotidyltransferase
VDHGELTPGDQDEVLRDFATRARDASRREQIDQDARTVITALTDARIDVLLLKGAALARTLYRREETRTYGDADLLVRPSALHRARETLVGLGYRSVEAVRGIDNLAGVLHAENWSRLRLDSSLGNLTIDLHHRLAGCDAPPEAVFDRLFASRAPIELAGSTVYTLDRAGLTLHLVLHLAHHGPADLKAAGDLERGLERWPVETWREAAALALELDAVDSFAAGLSLIPAGAELLANLGLAASAGRLWTIHNRGLRPRGTFHLQAWKEAPGISARLSLTRRALFPPRAWIRWEYPWSAPGGPRLALAYALHVGRAPTWALRAWWYRRRVRAAARG